MRVAIKIHGSRKELPGRWQEMKRLFVGLMLVAILGVGAASASAQGFDRGRRVTVIATPQYGYNNGWDRRAEWRRMERERIEREQLARERWGQRFNQDRFDSQRFNRNRDRNRDFRVRQF
jgi:hypothetical protein